MIRFAVIGTSIITEKFLEAAALVPNLKLEAVYSRSLSKAREFSAGRGPVRLFDSLTELAEDQSVDAVYIASPNSLHCSQALLMMQHGKHVLCEKPFASNLKESEKMVQCAKERKVVLLEAMRPVYDPGFRKIIELLPSVGTVRQVTFQYCQYSSRYDKFKQGIIENAFRPEFSNGALMDIGVYLVHPLVVLFGEPDTICGHMVRLPGSIDGAGALTAGYTGMTAQLTYSKINGSLPASQIMGEEGCLVIDQIPSPTVIRLEKRGGGCETFTIEKHQNNMFYEAEAWATLIETCADPTPWLNGTLKSISLLDRARKCLGLEFSADRT